MTKEELIATLSKEMVKLLDADWVSDELDNLLPDVGYINPQTGVEVISLSEYDEALGALYREVTLKALGDVLITLAGEVPNP